MNSGRYGGFAQIHVEELFIFHGCDLDDPCDIGERTTSLNINSPSRLQGPPGRSRVWYA